MSRARKNVVWIGIPSILLLGIGLFVLASHRGASQDHAAAQPALVAAEVIAVTRQPFPVVDEVPGTVAARQHAEISPKVMSHIEAIYVREGDRVTKGQLLARLEGKDIAVSVQQASAGVQNAEAAYAQAKTAYAMQRTQSAVAVAQAQAALEQAKAQLAKAKQGPRPEQVRQAEEQEARAKAGYEQALAYLDLAKEGARTQQKQQAAQAVIAAQGQVAQVEAGLSAAKANLTTVQNDYARIKALYEQDIMPKQKLDHVTAQLEAARSGVRQAEAGVKAAEAGLQMAKAQASLVNEGARSQEITAAEKQVAQAKASYEQAKQEAAMAKQGGRWEDVKTAEEGVRQAEQAVRAAKAAQARDEVSEKDIARAAAGIAMAKAERARAGTMLGYTNIYAPFSGVVTARRADPGTMAMPQMPILVIDDDAHYQLVSNVPESIAARLATGTAARVVLPSLNATVDARIVEVVPSASTAARTLTVKANLPRIPGVQSGLFGRLQVTTAEELRLMAPRAAIRERNGLTGLYRVDADGQARYTLVTLGKAAGDRVQVLSGLDDGQRIVAHIVDGLADGVRVHEEGAGR
ncbi:MAG: putative efflux pump membrane fusion protein [bacterium ADurb.Bin429]|nr:MAG: putative efflux pump membrane fusion protein [bacterium ADurb.Bin429]